MLHVQQPAARGGRGLYQITKLPKPSLWYMVNDLCPRKHDTPPCSPTAGRNGQPIEMPSSRSTLLRNHTSLPRAYMASHDRRRQRGRRRSGSSKDLENFPFRKAFTAAPTQQTPTNLSDRGKAPAVGTVWNNPSRRVRSLDFLQ